ncbi:MAG: flagellin lysine-N-methylase [Acutalibacteraceae bacterium]|nr:flagellin lysine-N-methylase [Acutalibacteraceae bacterium]
MKYCQPKYYNDFNCIAADCTDTCCRYWQVELDKKSVSFYREYGRDNKSELPVRFIGGAFGNRHFKNKQNGDCIFLNESKLCKLYCKVGHENLPETCQLYPRFINNFGGYEERGLSFSCPTAAALITQNELALYEYLDDTPIYSFVDIDAELFITLKTFRNHLIEYIDEFDDVNTIFSFVISSAYLAQKHIDVKEYSKVSALSIKDIYENMVNIDFYKLRYRAVKEHMSHKHLRSEWPKILHDSINTSFIPSLHFVKIWAKYFVFRYLLKASYDGLVYERLCAVVYSALVIFGLKLDYVTAMQKYSKETEHNEYNLKRLFKDAKSMFSKNIVDK